MPIITIDVYAYTLADLQVGSQFALVEELTQGRGAVIFEKINPIEVEGLLCNVHEVGFEGEGCRGGRLWVGLDTKVVLLR